jgi:hypothetical protein
MKRRKFLLGVGSAAAAGSALIGSGAFSRVEADRSVTIQVAKDPNAYLGMDDCRIDGSETPNSSFAHLDDLGHLKIDMSPSNPTEGGGKGINSDSSTWAHNVFQICNQGKEGACVWIKDDFPVVPEGEKDAGKPRVDFYLGDNPTRSIVGKENAITPTVGECLCIGIRTRSYGLSEGDELLSDLDNEVKIVADVDDCPTPPADFPPTETGPYPTFQVDLYCGETQDPVWGSEGELIGDRLLEFEHADYAGNSLGGGSRSGNCSDKIENAELTYDVGAEASTASFEVPDGAFGDDEELTLSYSSYGNYYSGGYCRYERQDVWETKQVTLGPEDNGSSVKLEVELPPLGDVGTVDSCDSSSYDDNGYPL